MSQAALFAIAGASSADGTLDGADGRCVNDAYYTPQVLADVLVGRLAEHMHRLGGLRVLEPSAGGGSFVRALQGLGAVVEARDIDATSWALQSGNADSASSGDFLGWSPEVRPDWVVGNPPYSDAEAHVRHACAVAGKGVAMLLRLAFLESAQRVPFWREFPASWVYVLSKRPSFTGGGTDSCAYGFFVWDHLDCPQRVGWTARMEVLPW